MYQRRRLTPNKSLRHSAQTFDASMRPLAVVAIFLLPAGSWACSVPPNSLFESDDALVQSADAVVLARVVGWDPAVTSPLAERRLALIHFEVEESLKGKAPQRFDLEGFATQETKDPKRDFDGHSMPEFWAGYDTNSVMPGDCKAYGVFESGGLYLIFLRQATHVRGFENVRSDQDLWLRVVRLLVQRHG